MKQLVKFSLMVTFVIGLSFQAQAQKKAGDKVFDDKKWYDNTVVGANFGLGYANGWNIEFSPRFGYQLIEERLRAGIGMNYNYISGQATNGVDIYDVNFNTIGPSVFVHLHVLNNIYIAGEGVVNYGNYEVETLGKRSFEETNFLVGGGFASSFGQGFSYDVQILLVTQFDRNNFLISSIYDSPLQYKIGVFYSF